MKTNYSLSTRIANRHKIAIGWFMVCILTPLITFAQYDIQNIALPGNYGLEQFYPMEVFNDEMYFSLSDGSIGVYGALFKYDGSTVTQVDLPTTAGTPAEKFNWEVNGVLEVSQTNMATETMRLAENYDMAVYGGELYMVLEDGSSGVYGALYKYDGSSFTAITMPGSGTRVNSETGMAVYNDELYMALEDGSNGIYSVLYKYDGAGFTQISLPENYRVQYPSEMATYNDELFVVLEDGSNGVYGALYRYDGSSFSEIVMPGTYRIDSDGSPLRVFKDELYLSLSDGSNGIYGELYKYDGTDLTLALPSNYRVQEEYSMEVYSGYMYMVLEDNGTSGEYYKFDGSSLFKVGLDAGIAVQYDYRWAVYQGDLYGVFDDSNNSISSGLFALTGSISSRPAVPVGDCGRTILDFESGSYAHVGTITGFSYVSGTFEAWVKKDDWTETIDDALFSNGIGFPFENSFYISFHPGAGLHFRYGGQSEAGNAAAYVSTTSTDTLADGSWHHIAATWHNNGSETRLITYIDGIEIANVATSENLVLSGTPEFGIGEGILNYLYGFDGGAMSEIKLWDVARTQEEVVTDMDVLMTGLESGLIAYWPMNDAQGSTAASNLVQPSEEAVLTDFSDLSNAWVNYPIELVADGNTILSQGTYDFGLMAVDGTADITFTITNHGFYDIALLGSPIAVLSGTDADEFTLDFTGTSTSLAAGASTSFTVSFHPTTLFEKTASFSITTFDSCSDPYEITIIGTGLNDDCSSAEQLTVYAKNTGTYTDGTTESAGIFGGSLSCAPDGTVNDVWYKFTTGSTGSVEINTELGTTTYLSGAIRLGCEVDAIYCVADLSSKVYLPVAPNTEVYLQIWNAAEDAGTFSVRINEASNTYVYTGWSAGSAPSSTDDALLVSSYKTYNEGSLEVNNLEIIYDGVLYAGGIEIEDGDYLKVNGNLVNNGGIYVKSGGSLITLGTIDNTDFAIVGFSFKGTAIERYTTFDQTTGRYSIMGSPVTDASFDMLGTNALIYGYDETQAYNPTGNEGLDRFKTPTQLGQTTMQPGQGYFSAFTGDEESRVLFFGTPNTGNIDVSLSYTDQETTEEEDFEGFNLVSNPYPTAINANEFMDANSSAIDQTIYLWDDNGSNSGRGSNADYLMVNRTLGATNAPAAGGATKWDGNIRSGQGFFVKTSAAGTLTFTDALKNTANSNGDGGFFRLAPVTRYKLILSNNNDAKATILGYLDDATTGLDAAYDALSLGGSAMQLYTIDPVYGKKMGIQGLPSDYDEGVRLGFQAEEAGTYVLRLDNLDEIQGSYFVLDRHTNQQIDLTQGAYSFNTQAGAFDDRFVVLSPQSILGLQEVQQISMYEKEGYLHLMSEQSIKAGSEYQIIDLMGKLIKSGTIERSSQDAEIYLGSTPKSVLIIRLIQDGKPWTGKILVK